MVGTQQYVLCVPGGWQATENMRSPTQPARAWFSLPWRIPRSSRISLTRCSGAQHTLHNRPATGTQPKQKCAAGGMRRTLLEMLATYAMPSVCPMRCAAPAAPRPRGGRSTTVHSSKNAPALRTAQLSRAHLAIFIRQPRHTG